MRLKELLLGASALTIMSVVSTSCTSEMVTPYPGTNTGDSQPSMLVAQPDFYAWSGNQQLGAKGSSLSRANDIIIEDVETTLLDADEEKKIIEEYLPEKNGNLKDGIQPNFLFKADKDITFELYPIYCQTNTSKTIGLFYYDNNGNYYEINDVFSGITQWEGRFREEKVWYPEYSNTIYFIGKKISIPQGYVFGFFWNGNTTYGPTTYYSVDSWNEEVYCTDGGGNRIQPEEKSKLHGVTFEINGKTYLGLEDWTDFDFQDLVFTCPENLVEVPANTIPPKGEQWTDNFPGGDGTSTTPGTGGNPGGNNGDGTPGEGGETPVLHNDEVEVNFSINDVHTDKNGQKYEAADLWTKLSIHVRKGTDVRIHVPLEGKYFCESDDFAIMQNHDNAQYEGGKLNEVTHSMTYQIIKDEYTSWTVTLNVEINADGMDVWTDGIDEGLIEYLFETNGDGINFEIWNYFQTETIDWIDGQKHIEPKLTDDEYKAFQGFLDQSTIKFLDEEPSYYINAFGYNWFDGTYTTDIRLRDCLVTPINENENENLFDMFENFCYHLNGTPWNIIWTNKNVDKTSDSYKHHIQTPDPAVKVNKY